MNRKVNLVLFVFWIALILFGVLSPSDSLSRNIYLFYFIPYFDKFVHGIMFFGFSFLLFLLLENKYSKIRSILFTGLLSICFGILTEALQFFLNEIIHRNFEWLDFLADVFGIIIALGLCYFIMNRNKNINRKISNK